jgi:hypothetical protein
MTMSESPGLAGDVAIVAARRAGSTRQAYARRGLVGEGEWAPPVRGRARRS